MAFYQLSSVNITVGNTSQTLVENNGSRIHFSIQNRGSENIYIHFGLTDATSSNGILVEPNQYFEPFNPGRGTIKAISATGNVECVMTEG